MNESLNDIVAVYTRIEQIFREDKTHFFKRIQEVQRQKIAFLLKFASEIIILIVSPPVKQVITECQKSLSLLDQKTELENLMKDIADEARTIQNDYAIEYPSLFDEFAKETRDLFQVLHGQLREKLEACDPSLLLSEPEIAALLEDDKAKMRPALH